VEPRNDKELFQDPKIVPWLPAPHADPEPSPPELIGATIVAIGSPDFATNWDHLYIDFIPKGENARRRIVFEFNDIAIWVAHRDWVSTPVESQQSSDERP
jgi:hypothetical protein